MRALLLQSGDDLVLSAAAGGDPPRDLDIVGSWLRRAAARREDTAETGPGIESEPVQDAA